MERWEYEVYIQENLWKYLEIDINEIVENNIDIMDGSFINTSSVKMNLEYLDDHLLKNKEDILSIEEKKQLVKDYFTFLDDDTKDRYMNDYLQVKDKGINWDDDVVWEVYEDKGKIFIKIEVR